MRSLNARPVAERRREDICRNLASNLSGWTRKGSTVRNCPRLGRRCKSGPATRSLPVFWTLGQRPFATLCTSRFIRSREWLATNWWFLTHEFGNPTKAGNPDFHRRHALGASREGYAFPSLEVVSSGARTHLVWERDRPPWTRVEFLDQGDIWMDSDEFREHCAGLIDQVIRRLVSLGIDETLLQEEWKRNSDRR